MFVVNESRIMIDAVLLLYKATAAPRGTQKARIQAAGYVLPSAHEQYSTSLNSDGSSRQCI